MSRDQLIGRGRRVLGRLAEPSSAAGLAALLALLVRTSHVRRRQSWSWL
jgi:hypothetical protein